MYFISKRHLYFLNTYYSRENQILMQKWSLRGFSFSADSKFCNLMQISFYSIYMAEEDIWLACESAGNLYYSLTEV